MSRECHSISYDCWCMGVEWVCMSEKCLCITQTALGGQYTLPSQSRVLDRVTQEQIANSRTHVWLWTWIGTDPDRSPSSKRGLALASSVDDEAALDCGCCTTKTSSGRGEQTRQYIAARGNHTNATVDSISSEATRWRVLDTNLNRIPLLKEERTIENNYDEDVTVEKFTLGLHKIL